MGNPKTGRTRHVWTKACPTCGAEAGSACKSRAGDIVFKGYLHAARCRLADGVPEPASGRLGEPAGRPTQEWMKVLRSVRCSNCEAAPDKPCHGPNGQSWGGTVHAVRRDTVAALGLLA